MVYFHFFSTHKAFDKYVQAAAAQVYAQQQAARSEAAAVHALPRLQPLAVPQFRSKNSSPDSVAIAPSRV
jgi:hypothetical protein